MTNETHIADKDLLRDVDGELSAREAKRVRAHLQSCWRCRTRHLALERAIENFVVVNRATQLPPIGGPRALLLARLRRLETNEPHSWWQRCGELVLQIRTLCYVGLALAALSVVGLTLYFGVHQVRAASIPDASLTPGATRTVTTEELCASRSTEGFYPIPAGLAYRVFEKYRIHRPRPLSYEVDYLITPALGGADDIRNLWPQPFASGEWNAHAKDALEDYLHKKVCAGEVDLTVAQRDIAVNWIAAYQKYFHADHPLPIHSNFSTDAPWED